jgi:hypothetical protein
MDPSTAERLVRVEHGWADGVDCCPSFSDQRANNTAVVGWPKQKPAAEINDSGWFLPGNMAAIETVVKNNDVRVILELGAYLGKSTRFICEKAPKARIYTCDLWCNDYLEESLGHNYLRTDNQKDRRKYQMYDTFLVNLWHERHRVVPMKMFTLQALEWAFHSGIKPDMIYIDADHDYEPVKRDIELSLALFPEAIIMGDDWDYAGVRRAVFECRALWPTTSNDGNKEGASGDTDGAAAAADGSDEDSSAGSTGANKSAPRLNQDLQRTRDIHVQDFKCWQYNQGSSSFAATPPTPPLLSDADGAGATAADSNHAGSRRSNGATAADTLTVAITPDDGITPGEMADPTMAFAMTCSGVYFNLNAKARESTARFKVMFDLLQCWDNLPSFQWYASVEQLDLDGTGELKSCQ